jgi:hypothetical protein
MAGMPLDALEHLSPEQIALRSLDGRSDLHALGVVGHELLALPGGDARTFVAGGLAADREGRLVSLSGGDLFVIDDKHGH